ncbi:MULTISPECIES: DMT family transporter [unclassified Neorhizobium]|uniref:DMT family transporter n=1 Tax=unclassified Neorhizobium TaxID=2629175 RepID=UPI001FF54BAD|nr:MULTISPECIES: DMT family transporter [unclassified Neorhizobium]MCJ9669028.1 DMT family transporter [Neorhizobium sp. SHOUNA12B]MCJ9744982.1 DMT family transporter [Neorhizobium sp. SHOUNA12A]
MSNSLRQGTSLGWLGAGLGSLSAILSGITVLAAKHASQDIDGLLLTGWRIGIGLACLGPIAIWPCRGVTLRLCALIVTVGAIVCGLTPWLIMEGLIRTDASTAVIVLCFTPVLTLIIARLLGRERGSFSRSFGAATAFVGLCLCVSSTGPLQEHSNADRMMGIGLLTVAAFSSAIYNVLARPLVSGAGALATTFLTMLGGAIALSIMILIRDHHVWSKEPSMETWILIFFVGAGGAVQSLLWLAAMRCAEAGKIAVLVTLSPLSTQILEVWLFGRATPAAMLAGIAAIIIGSCLALRSTSSPSGPQSLHPDGKGVRVTSCANHGQPISPATAYSRAVLSTLYHRSIESRCRQGTRLTLGMRGHR